MAANSKASSSGKKPSHPVLKTKTERSAPRSSRQKGANAKQGLASSAIKTVMSVNSIVGTISNVVVVINVIAAARASDGTLDFLRHIGKAIGIQYLAQLRPVTEPISHKKEIDAEVLRAVKVVIEIAEFYIQAAEELKSQALRIETTLEPMTRNEKLDFRERLTTALIEVLGARMGDARSAVNSAIGYAILETTLPKRGVATRRNPLKL
jgi:hypothetical protein